jgi:hypothetical protein
MGSVDSSLPGAGSSELSGSVLSSWLSGSAVRSAEDELVLSSPIPPGNNGGGVDDEDEACTTAVARNKSMQTSGKLKRCDLGGDQCFDMWNL